MLSGAVVGGGAGAAAIYYNPANIAEIEQSGLSVSISLFSLDNYKIKNALGNGIDLNRTKLTAQPRLVTYLIEVRRNKKISLELAIMNVANSNVRLGTSVDMEMDILKSLPGVERYFASYYQENIYRDDYIGGGISYKINDGFWIGSSMFVSVKTMRTIKGLDIDASPLTDTVYANNNPVPFYVASYNKFTEIRFQNYSLIWKFGLNYKINTVNIGLNITTPALNVFTGGKFARKKEEQNSITNPDGSRYFPDYIAVDEQKKKELNIKIKTPFSIALGATFHSPSDPDKSFFFTVEYFSSISPYKMIDAEDYQYVLPINQPGLDSTGFLDYSMGGRNLLNFAIGYRWKISENVLMLSGFKTDFNFLKGVDIGNNRLDNFHINFYHITGGLRFKLKKNVIFFGLQYSFARKNNREQIVNLSDPVEYNDIEKAPLQGTRQDNMNISYNGLSFFLGATFNFGGTEKKK